MKRLLLLVFLLSCSSSMLAQISNFASAGNMNSTRVEHTATLLSGGTQVLIAGGLDSSATTLNSAEVYDLTTGKFTLTSSMQQARQLHTATLLDNGKVLIVSGYYPYSGWLTSAELYDPSSSTFTLTGSMTTGRQWHTATLLKDGRVLITGGSTQIDSVPVNLSSTEVYDPSTGTFSAGPSMTYPRYGHTATLLSDGTVLIAGGCGTGLTPDCTNTAEIYDPVANAFTLTGNMVQPHAWHTGTLLNDGTVLIAGGVQGSITANCAEIYDPTSGTFTTTTSAMVGQDPTYHTGTILLDGSVLVAGGIWTSPSVGTSREAQLYLSGAFSLVTGTMTDPRYQHTATRLGNGQVLIAGGTNDSSTALSSADLYLAPGAITQPVSPSGGTASFVFNNNAYNINYTYPAGFVSNNNYSLTVTPLQTSQAAWGSRTSGTPYAGTQLAPVSGLGGDGIIYEAVCHDALNNPCPEPPADDSFAITTSWDGPVGSNPGFLKADIGETNWQDVLYSYSPTRTDPTVVGKSKDGFSDWAVVYNVSQTSPANISITAPNGSYNLNQVVNANYTCGNSSDVASCIGDVPNNSPIDTSSAGSKTFTVLATVKSGMSASKIVNYTVLPIVPTVTFTGAPTTAVYESTFTVTATTNATTIPGITPSGPCSVGTVTGTPASASAIVAMTSGTGTCTLTATWVADANYTAASLNQFTTALKAGSVSTITSNTPNPSAPGQAVAVSFQVTGNGSPSGTVTVAASTGETCTVSLSAGAGTCSLTFVTVGSRTLTASYSGDTNFNSSISAAVTQSVNGPLASLSPASVSFGNVYLGLPAVQTVTLANVGNAPMSVGKVQVSGGNDSDDFIPLSLCPSTLPAGKSCQVLVGFLADADNYSPTAVLSVNDNALGSPQTVALGATVNNPIASLSSYNLNFGKQKVGTPSAVQTVTLRNTGTTSLVLYTVTIGGDFTLQPGTSCVNGETLAVGVSCTISVTFTPTAKGTRLGSVRVKDNALINQQIVALSGTGI